MHESRLLAASCRGCVFTQFRTDNKVTSFTGLDYVLSWRYLWIKRCVDSRAQTERGNTRGGATKKRKISRTLLSINLHFSVHVLGTARGRGKKSQNLVDVIYGSPLTRRPSPLQRTKYPRDAALATCDAISSVCSFRLPTSPLSVSPFALNARPMGRAS